MDGEVFQDSMRTEETGYDKVAEDSKSDGEEDTLEEEERSEDPERMPGCVG